MKSEKLREFLLMVKANTVLPFATAKSLIEDGLASNNGEPVELTNPKSWFPLEITSKGRDVLWPSVRQTQ